MGGLEQKYVHETFVANWISSEGPNLAEFEKDLENYLQNGAYVGALSSGAAAIHLGLVFIRRTSRRYCHLSMYDFSA